MADRYKEQEFGWAKLFHIVVDSGVWAQLSEKARAVYIVLLRHTDDITRNCWPGNELIAKEAGIHVRTVSAALAELERRHLIKKWRKDRKNFYHVYSKKDLICLLPAKMDVSTSPRKMAISPPRKSRDSRGRFIRPSTMEKPAPPPMEQPCPSAVEAVVPASMEEKESSLRRISQEDQEKKIKSPAVAMKGYIEYLIPEKLTRTSFYYHQRQTKAHKKPTPELTRWLRTYVRLTEEELRELFASEYPDWKPTNGEFGG